MAQKVEESASNKEDLLKEMEDIEELKSHLEEEYRKANISEKNYQELKEKHENRLKDIKKKLDDTDKGDKSKKEESPNKKSVVEEHSKEEESLKSDPKTEKKTGGGLLSNIFKRGPKPAPKNQQSSEESVAETGGSEEEDLIEQAALAVGSVMEGAADQIEGAKEKMGQISQNDLEQNDKEEKQPSSSELRGEGDVSNQAVRNMEMELEKLKIMMDGIRDSKKASRWGSKRI